jgi:hypothetical protein
MAQVSKNVKATLMDLILLGTNPAFFPLSWVDLFLTSF